MFMKKFTLLLVALFSVQLSAQNISGCITSMPDSISNVKIVYLRGKGLAVKQEIPVNRGCFNAEWEHPEKGIFIIYLDGSHTFDFLLSNGDVKVSGDYNDLQNVKVSGPGIAEFDGFKSLLQSEPKEAAIRSYLSSIRDQSLKEFLMPQIIPQSPDTNIFWLREHFWDYTNLNSKSTLINPFFEK